MLKRLPGKFQVFFSEHFPIKRKREKKISIPKKEKPIWKCGLEMGDKKVILINEMGGANICIRPSEYCQDCPRNNEIEKIGKPIQIFHHKN